MAWKQILGFSVDPGSNPHAGQFFRSSKIEDDSQHKKVQLKSISGIEIYQNGCKIKKTGFSS
jgi:hypothetical protein